MFPGGALLQAEFNHQKSGISARELSQALKPASKSMSGLLAIKTLYRPYICPLGWVLSQIPEGTRLYDIGCGTGSLLFLSLRFRLAKLAHGYDVALGAVKASNAFGRDFSNFRVDYIQPENTPPDLSGYDTITMIDVMHHIPPNRQDDFIRETIARMDSGAKLIIKDIEASKVLGAWMNQLHDLLLSREWVHQRRSQDIVRLLKSAGAEVDQPILRWTLWYPHFLIVAYVP
jgi:2-polyprenyl-3-methyl-5-hydroxy-6-metoxy-1,4-benzoquinol methylase